MEVHVAVLRPGGKAEAVWRKGKSMYCTEMACDITELLVINNAHHSYGETTLCCLGGCDLSGVLTTRKEHVEFLHLCIIEEGADRGRSARLHEFKNPNRSQGLGVEKLRIPVS